MLGRTGQEGAASDVSKYWWGERGSPLTITVARDVFMERLERRNNNIVLHGPGIVTPWFYHSKVAGFI